MPTPLSPTFTRLTNNRYLWRNVQEANTFFDSFSFTISGANLPAPTVSDLGGVKLLEIVTPFAAPAVAGDDYQIVADDGSTVLNVASQARLTSVEARLEYAVQQLTTLYAQLSAKGYVAS